MTDSNKKCLSEERQLELRRDASDGVLSEMQLAAKYGVSRFWIRRHRYDQTQSEIDAVLASKARAEQVVAAAAEKEAAKVAPNYVSIINVEPTTPVSTSEFVWTVEAENKVLRRLNAGIMPQERPDDADEPSMLAVMCRVQEDRVFASKYNRSLRSCADSLVLKSLELVSQAPERIVSKSGRMCIDPAYCTYVKMRVDTQLKIASFINPERYGSKTNVSIVNSDVIQEESQIDTSLYTDEELTVLVGLLQRRVNKANGE